MTRMAHTLTDGFRLHDCEVHPSRNVVTGPGGEQHLEPKAMQVLVVLAAHAGEVVTRETLLDEVWPDTYSGDAALTRCVSLLRAALGEGKDKGRFIETVSKAGYRLTADVEDLAAGESSAPADEPPNETESGNPTPRAPLAWVGAAVLVLALAVWFWPSSPFGTGAENAAPVAKTIPAAVTDSHPIAVLPFANMSGDDANEYFSDGVAEEILNVLAQIPRLRVTSRSSSFAFRNREIPLSAVAEQLGVESILEGSVRKFDGRVRISVQLIDAGNDAMLWSETYDRTFDDLFAVQEEIALSVADTLRIALDIDEIQTFESQRRLTPIAPEAHEAYLRGRYLVAKRTRRALEDAVTAFEQALAIEPEYAPAMAQLAIATLLLTRRNYGDLSEAEALARATPHADEAMRLAPGDAESQAAAGMVALHRGELRNAEQRYLRALEINPNFAIVHHWLSMLQYRNLGKHEEAFESTMTARRLDPVSIPTASIYFQMLLHRGRFDDAATELAKLEAISPATHHRMRAFYEALDGNWANLVLANLDALMVDPETTRTSLPIRTALFALGLEHEVLSFAEPDSISTLRELGRTDEAVRLAETRFEEDTASVWAERHLARALAAHGEIARARLLLESLFDKSEGHVAVLGNHYIHLLDALALYQARWRDGDEAGASEILRAIEAENRSLRAAGLNVTRMFTSVDFSEGIVRYLDGDETGGLALIRRAVEAGYVIGLRPWVLGRLLQDPNFEPILDIQKATAERERARLLAVVCADVSPYTPVWRPLPETCAPRG